MEIIAKCAAISIFVSLVCLLIKKHNPEISAVISICAVTLVLVSLTGIADAIKDLVSAAVDMLGAQTTFIRPMMKCMGIAYITKFSADICRDTSQSAAATVLEMGGSLCAFSVALPLIISVLKMIGTMV